MPVKQITNWTVFNKIQTATMTFIACLTRFRLISHPFENLHRIPTGPLRFITVPIAYPFPSEPPRECPYPRKHWKKRHVSAQLRLQDDTGADPRFRKKQGRDGQRFGVETGRHSCALRVLLYTAPDTGLLSRQAGRQPPSSAVFTCIGPWAPPPQPNGAPRKKVFTGFPLQLIFAKVKAEN